MNASIKFLFCAAGFAFFGDGRAAGLDFQTSLDRAIVYNKETMQRVVARINNPDEFDEQPYRAELELRFTIAGMAALDCFVTTHCVGEGWVSWPVTSMGHLECRPRCQALSRRLELSMQLLHKLIENLCSVLKQSGQDDKVAIFSILTAAYGILNMKVADEARDSGRMIKKYESSGPRYFPDKETHREILRLAALARQCTLCALRPLGIEELLLQ